MDRQINREIERLNTLINARIFLSEILDSNEKEKIMREIVDSYKKISDALGKMFALEYYKFLDEKEGENGSA